MLHPWYYCASSASQVLDVRLLRFALFNLFGIIGTTCPRARDFEARLERAEQELRLFQRVSRLMTRDMELDEVLQEIVSLVRAFLNCDSCLIYLKEDDELVLFASSDADRKNIGRVRLR